MQLIYETPRLVLQVLKGDHHNADKVLAFYEADRELFERFEPDRVPNYYTSNFHKCVLRQEYNLAIAGQHIRYHIFLKENPDRIIGTVCLHNIQNNYYSRCEIGYKIASDFHRQGYAKEAINQILFAAFEEMQIHRVSAWVDSENFASSRLLEKLGFQKEGLCEDYVFQAGRWHDHFQYSMLNPFQAECGKIMR